MIHNWLQKAEENWELGTNDGQLSPMTQFCMLVWPESTESSKDIKRLYSVLHQTWISFDMADTILCRLRLAHLWREDPELAALYQTVDLTWLDYARPTCPEVDQRNRSRVRAVKDHVCTLRDTSLKLGIPETLTRSLLEAA